MSVALITGSAGLIGSEACRMFNEKGFKVVGIDNDLRKYFFGESASTHPTLKKLQQEISDYTHYNEDIRNYEGIKKIVEHYGKNISVVVHTAAQPSHDWAAKEPFTDFTVNANGTLNLLEATRQYCPDAVFIFTSTNKVYGDTPNYLPLLEKELRWEVDENHPFFKHGINETMSIDNSKHSLFGASKVAADILVQEYGKYFGMNTGVFRGGCLTGPSHKGAELHGFLAYLIKCTVERKKYTIFGYKGKQVRDNIHSHDLNSAFWHFFNKPKQGEVYNIGGSRHSNVSILEAIKQIQELSGIELDYELSEKNRIGDHIWYISDVNKFKSHYPEWSFKYDSTAIIKEMVEASI